MNKGETIFSQIMSLIPERDFKLSPPQRGKRGSPCWQGAVRHTPHSYA